MLTMDPSHLPSQRPSPRLRLTLLFCTAPMAMVSIIPTLTLVSTTTDMLATPMLTMERGPLMLSPKLRLMPGTDITDTPMLMEVTEPMVMDTPTITMERGPPMPRPSLTLMPTTDTTAMPDPTDTDTDTDLDTEETTGDKLPAKQKLKRTSPFI